MIIFVYPYWDESHYVYSIYDDYDIRHPNELWLVLFKLEDT